MAQRTLVIQLDASRAKTLQRELERSGFEFRGVPHASFSARQDGVIATMYTSGKLVVQSADPDTFCERFLGIAAAPREETREETTVGSDESGKGDYFGPLVVAAVRLEAALARELRGGPVRDSKLIDDESCLRLGAALRAKLPHAIARLDPPAYNAEHARVKNLNPMLAKLHGVVIKQLASPGMLVVVDQFGPERLVAHEVEGTDVRLVQRPRGEEILAVAAASVIAREQFLRGLQELSEQWGLDLCKGAGDPTDRAARKFVAVHGFDKLGNVAKLHFRTTQKIGGSR
ncbi:MAG: ribonuclease HIII [Planctomycetes bacterium]|nr:ribonuclease HIII [Planctomycetota bacterium]